jgi:hypothetical protein
MLCILKEPASVITKTANYFEVLYILNDNGTQKINREVRSDTQSYTKNSNKKNWWPSTKESSKAIPVIINGVTLVERNKNIRHKVIRDVQQKQGYKIVIIGDSHA